MLSTKPMDASQLTFRYSGAAEHYEYNRDTQQRAASQTIDVDDNGHGSGMPLWKIRCVAVYKTAGEHGEITVTVPHPEPPAAEFDSEISFTDLTVKDWAMNGDQGQTWHAATFAAAAPTVPPSAAKQRRPAEVTAA